MQEALNDISNESSFSTPVKQAWSAPELSVMGCHQTEANVGLGSDLNLLTS